MDVEPSTTLFPSVPYRRSFSVVSTHDNGALLLFGGCSRDKASLYNDLWQASNVGEWRYVLCARAPPRRYGHAAVWIPATSPLQALAGCMVVHGGTGANGKLLDDAWVFDPRAVTWRPLPVADVTTLPPARTYHTLTVCDAHGLLLFGGATEKNPRGTKHAWLWRDGSWHALHVHSADAQKRFKHVAWYWPAKEALCVYGGISGHGWMADVWMAPLQCVGRETIGWRLLRWTRDGVGKPVHDGRAITSENCVLVDPTALLVLGSTYAMLMRVSSHGVRVEARLDQLPEWWKGTSPGIQGVVWRDHRALFFNLFPKLTAPVMEVRMAQPNAPLVVEPLAVQVPAASAWTQPQPLCHRPPLAPVPVETLLLSMQSAKPSGLYWDQGRWCEWKGDSRTFVALPDYDWEGGFSTDPGEASSSDVAMASFATAASGASAPSLHLPSDDPEDEDEQREEMPLLVEVEAHRVTSVLKRAHALVLTWEKRGVKQRVRSERKFTKEDLEIFSVSDPGEPFDWRHFSFSLLRGLFLSVFALFYLFSRRFGWRAKLLLVALGFLHVGVISIPIIAYQWPESTLLPQAGLVWTPVVAYFVILFVHCTIEGSWRDTGGLSASVTWLDQFKCHVSDERGRMQEWRGGDFITHLIEQERSMVDPWEYQFLAFYAAIFFGLFKAGLFILIGYFLGDHQVDVASNPWVHVVFALAMLLNAVTTSAFLSMLGMCAYLYRRQLRLLRLVAACVTVKESRRLHVPHLPLRSVANVRFWTAMRTFAMSRKAHLPLTSANVVVGVALIVTAVLWIVLVISVFVERTRTSILIPINVTLAFFAIVLFYYVAVCVRQFVLLNNNLRSHPGILSREAIRMQLEGHAKSEARRLLKQLDDLLRLESSSFRILNVEIPQASLNVLLGLFLPLSVATLTNVLLDVASDPTTTTTSLTTAPARFADCCPCPK